MEIKILKAISRIAHSSDGNELIEYLEELEKSNYKDIKYCDPSLREIYVGKAQAIGEIKDFILNADSEVRSKTKDDPSEWSL